MRRTVAFLAIATAGLVAAASASGAPAVRFSDDISGDVITCEGGFTLTVLEGGTLEGVFHEDESASGNLNFTGTIVPKAVLQGSDGQLYRASGAVWFGGAFNAQSGTETFTFTQHIVFVGKGGVGIGGTIHITEHISPNGTSFSLEFGTCEEPPE
jgi:hypothetical protein